MRQTRRVWCGAGIGAAGLFLLLSTAASAQVAEGGAGAVPTCQGGRVVTDATAGRCCWPNQTWNSNAGRCEGPPACPAGTVASGDDCASQSVPPPPATGAAPPPATADGTLSQPYPTAQSYAAPPPGQAAAGQPPPPGYPPSGPPRFEDTGETRPRIGLIVAGAAMFGASYITSALMAGSLIDAGDDGGVALYIPFVGPLICMGTCDIEGAEASVSLLLVLDALVQIAGVTLFTLGFVLQSPVRRQVAEVEGPIFGVRPWMSPTAAGVSFTGTNF